EQHGQDGRQVHVLARRVVRRRQGGTRPVELREPRLRPCPVQAGEHRQHREERLMPRRFDSEGHTPRSLFSSYASPLLSREQAKALADKVLSFAKADETRVVIASNWSGNTRFAGGEITTSGGITDTTLSVVSTIGKRRASVSSNVFDDASMGRTVGLAGRRPPALHPT